MNINCPMSLQSTHFPRRMDFARITKCKCGVDIKNKLQLSCDSCNIYCQKCGTQVSEPQTLFCSITCREAFNKHI